MIETRRYARAPFYVDAVQVTDENMADVAEWCAGEIKTTDEDNGEGTKYIKVKVLRSLGDDQTMAFVGRWVLKAGTGFKVYKDSAFHRSFPEQVSDASIMHAGEESYTDKDNRSAKTGRYVSDDSAKTNPDTTVTEKVTKKRRRPVPKDPQHLTSTVGDSLSPEDRAKLKSSE